VQASAGQAAACPGFEHHVFGWGCLATYREMKCVELCCAARFVWVSAGAALQGGVDAGRAWQLQVYVNDDQCWTHWSLDRRKAGISEGKSWRDVRIDLKNMRTRR